MELTHLPSINSPADLKALSVNQLPELADEVRWAICEQVKKSGGHLAPNLGVVELTIALHYVFDFGHDRLLFDVGHQCYPHKLLTGRAHLLGKLRQRGGMSGFPEPRESNFDLFSVGHAGTAISTAVGMARGDMIQGEGCTVENPDGRRTVALIGDASIVNGVAMEGLNNAGTLDRQFLVVLNDNGMSIAKPQGAVAGYFDRIRLNSTYRSMKRTAKDLFRSIPGGEALRDMSHRFSEMAKEAVTEDNWFEKFGLLTVGPIDGHDIPTLVDMLSEVRDFEHPMVLHVHTVKGKGFEFSEGDATTFHSPKPFSVNGCRVELKSSSRSFTSAYSDAMCDLMERDDSVVACTAAMPDGTGIKQCLDRFPDRTWDTGICESHEACAIEADAGCIGARRITVTLVVADEEPFVAFPRGRIGDIGGAVEMSYRRKLPPGVGIHVLGVKPRVAGIKLTVVVQVGGKAHATDIVLIGNPGPRPIVVGGRTVRLMHAVVHGHQIVFEIFLDHHHGLGRQRDGQNQ